jgi:GT2 family glycosyltransferase
VSLISAEQNGGFSYGNNIGFNFASADYYLLLNSDAYVREGAIQSLIATAKAHPSVGIIGPTLEWPDGRQQVSCFYNLSPMNSFLHSIKIGVFTKILSYFGVKEVAMPIELHSIEPPEWLSFACVLVRGEMVKDIGLMDEKFFMYREDNDYCRRAIAAGWSLKFDPTSRVVHLNNGHSNQMGVKRLPNYYFRSRSRYFIKYYGRFGLFFANVLWSLGRCVSLLREFIQQQPKAFHSTMLFDIWAGFFSLGKEK